MRTLRAGLNTARYRTEHSLHSLPTRPRTTRTVRCAGLLRQLLPSLALRLPFILADGEVPSLFIVPCLVLRFWLVFFLRRPAMTACSLC
jgi:hypothetical protein